MKPFAVAAPFLITACLWSQPSRAEDLVSGNDFLPACKAELNGPADSTAHVTAHVHDAGICNGVIKGLMTVADVLPPSLRFCIPDGMTIGPAIGVTVAYLEAKPERRNESFVLLALEAFAQAWPCKRAK
jgi:hypothetical protein